MKKELICITCPMGCHLSAELNEQNEVVSVSGNSCPRGAKYARKELTEPERVLTTTVKINHALHRLLPVMSSGSIPKKYLTKAMEEINQTEVNAPVKYGDVVVENICGCGIDIIASRSMDKYEA